MLVAFSLLAVFVLGVFALMYYYPTATAQTSVKAASELDAQEVLKRIVEHTGDPPEWTSLSEVHDFGLADAKLPGMLDPHKIMALASAEGGETLQCIIDTPKKDYPVTKIGYGIYMWDWTQQSIDSKVYERILRSLFGGEWEKYDIELRIRPALNVKIWNKSNTVYIKVDPPGVYRYDLSVVYFGQSSGVLYDVQVLNAAICWQKVKGKTVRYLFLALYNGGMATATINTVVLGNYVNNTANIQIGPGLVACPTFKLPDSFECESQTSCNGYVKEPPYVYVPFKVSTDSSPNCNSLSCPSPPKNVFDSSVSPKFISFGGYTDEDGSASVVVPGEFLFAFAYVRGVALRGLNYTYGGGGDVSLVGLVAQPGVGVYVVHSKLIQNVGHGASLCGCSEGGLQTLGLRYFGLFLGGQTVPLYQDLTILPSQKFDPNEVCEDLKKKGSGSSDKEWGGCRVPWDKLGRAKFIIAVIERNSQGQPPKCGEIPQRDVIVMPLTGGLPPLTEVHFATWRRWTDKRPESLVASYAKTVADAGEVTYVVELWVFRR